MSLKNSNETIGNRTRNLPVCSVVHLCNSTHYGALNPIKMKIFEYNKIYTPK